ncbi:MAG: MAPEG family protein [Alphaproteobacteria bacterium]|nr:MAG: MAPEG family protein [Alphaproteobacteria bacterium]
MLAHYPYTIAATLVIIALFLVFGARVGAGRGKHKVNAPACEGPDEWNRHFRIHQNTMEQMVQFLPLMWILAAMGHDMWAGALGALFIFGRLLYASAYARDPEKRGPGMILTFLASAIALIAIVVGWVMSVM